MNFIVSEDAPEANTANISQASHSGASDVKSQDGSKGVGIRNTETQPETEITEDKQEKDKASGEVDVVILDFVKLDQPEPAGGGSEKE